MYQKGSLFWCSLALYLFIQGLEDLHDDLVTLEVLVYDVSCFCLLIES